MGRKELLFSRKTAGWSQKLWRRRNDCYDTSNAFARVKTNAKLNCPRREGRRFLCACRKLSLSRLNYWPELQSGSCLQYTARWFSLLWRVALQGKSARFVWRDFFFFFLVTIGISYKLVFDNRLVERLVCGFILLKIAVPEFISLKPSFWFSRFQIDGRLHVENLTFFKMLTFHELVF